MQTPAQVAKRANVTAQTIRNYSTEYAALLSRAARGEDGPRLYDEQDVETLCTIASLRKSGVPPGEVVQRLQNANVPPIVDVTPQTPLNEPLEPLKTPLKDDLALPAVQSITLRRVEALERQMEALAQEQRAQMRDLLWQGRFQGAMAGMVMLMAFLMVAWLLVNGAPW
jgi:DNA-binding transcriptional MerR regulator